MAIARKLLVKQGYQRTTLQDIADVAKVTKAALYYYFPNKETLFERVMLDSLRSHYDEVLTAVARARTPIERIQAFMERAAYLQDSDRDRWVAASNAFLETSRTTKHPDAVALRDKFEGLLRQLIEEGIATGDLRPMDPAMAGRLLLSALSQMPVWHKPGGRLTSVEAIREFLEMLFNGMRAPHQIAASERHADA